MEKREWILLAVILAAVCGFSLANKLLYSAPAAVVEVSVIDENSNKTVLETFDLSEDTVFTILIEPDAEGEPEGINVLMIQDGKAWISEANCPNLDCVHKGTISQNGEMLVCLPHRMTVSISGESY